MTDLGLVIFALIFWFIFFGPHMKSKEKKEDKKGGNKK